MNGGDRQLPRGTVTLLFTDIEGSTRLLQELGREAYVRALTAHRRLLRDAFTRHGGVEVDTQGDSFFFAFPYARDAVAAAVAGQRALAEHDWESQPIRIRIGLHVGEPMQADGLYAGLDVHHAARIMSAAHGGQTLLSHRTAELVANELPAETTLRDLGEHRLKDLTAPQRLFQTGGDDFPPLKTLARPNLPLPTTSFIGRELEVSHVAELLVDDEARLVTLSGPGGTGKTRLAIHAATQASSAFPDGVHWVGLAALRDPDLVLGAIAGTLAARGNLSEHIGAQQLLIVLDNFEQVVEAAPGVGALVAQCPGLKVLVTSRQTLRVSAEVEYAVPPLVEGDAVALFCARSRLAPTPEIGVLCTRLDSLPLAVELAAARTKALSPAQILDRLSQRLDLLKGGRDADPRQQTLRATIEWSYQLLTEAEQELFRRLSVFAGGCTLAAAEDVAAADLDRLESLVEKNLVRFSDERYWMLEAIREYGVERLDETPTARESRAKHAEWFGALLDRAEPELEGPDQDVWLDQLDREHDNIRAALRWALPDADSQLALRIAGSSATFWWVRGHWTEGRRWCEEALSRTGEEPPAPRAKTLEGAAHLAYRQQDYARANELVADGLELCDELGDARRTARMLRIQGLVRSGEGDYEAFRALVERSAAHAREASDGWALMMALNNLGYLALESGERHRAMELFEEALQAARTRGDQRTEGLLLENLGLAKLELGEAAAAGADFAASLRQAQRLGFLEMAADGLMGIAAVAASKGRFDDAARLLGGARQQRELIGAGLDPVEARVEATTAAEVQRQLAPPSYAEAVQSGRDQRFDELVAFALATLD